MFENLTSHKTDTNNTDKNTNRLDLLVGVLLLIPIFSFFIVLLINLYILDDADPILILITTYSPIIVGLVLSLIYYKDKLNKITQLLYVPIIFFLGISCYFNYLTYAVDHEGFDGLGYFFMLIITTAIYKILIYILYAKITNTKKALLFLIPTILSFIVCFFG